MPLLFAESMGKNKGEKRKQKVKFTKISQQQAKHEKLYFDLFHAIKGEPLITLGSLYRGPSFLLSWYLVVGKTDLDQKPNKKTK